MGGSPEDTRSLPRSIRGWERFPDAPALLVKLEITSVFETEIPSSSLGESAVSRSPHSSIGLEHRPAKAEVLGSSPNEGTVWKS